ncbi:MAG: hypothetical protein H7145_13795, partial [Akkermansiaceae bacterium]|nr:hypothetical protein [Armatimonadota bacterium]
RVYETAGCATEATVTVSDAWANQDHVWTCDLRENRGEGITSTAADALRFTLQPFQIQTLRFGRSPQVK